MSIEIIKQNIVKMNEELAEVRKTYQEKLQTIFKQTFVEYFENNPEVNAVGWRQYTPYFNDGEPCEFRCYTECAFATNAIGDQLSEVEYGEYNGDDKSIWVLDPDYGCHNEEAIPEGVEEKHDALLTVLGLIENSVFLELFGDHCTVIATRKGFDIHEYSHD